MTEANARRSYESFKAKGMKAEALDILNKYPHFEAKEPKPKPVIKKSKK